MSYITDITASEMIEATRLTREGRLAEATALLQRLLRSKAAPNTADHASCDTAGGPYVDLRRFSWQEFGGRAW